MKVSSVHVGSNLRTQKKEKCHNKIPRVEDGNVDRMNLTLKAFLRYVLVKRICSWKLQRFMGDTQYH